MSNADRISHPLHVDKQPKVLKRWKTLSACNAGRSLLRLRNRRRVVQFAKMNGNSSVTPARNGRRSSDYGLIITTAFEEEAPRLLGIGTEPEFAIGQRALLLQSPGGNLLWDCISLLDDETIAEVNARGGIRAIAISHPHFYSSMIEWAECFDAQIFLHSADREWVMRKSRRIQFWEGTTLSLWDELTLINCGGHFEGGTVLHWPTGANGKGALLTGDIIHRRAGSPLRQLYAQLSESDSARAVGDPPHRRKNRTVRIRADLRRLVEGECSRGCKSSRCAIRRTLSALDQRVT